MGGNDCFARRVNRVGEISSYLDGTQWGLELPFMSLQKAGQAMVSFAEFYTPST